MSTCTWCGGYYEEKFGGHLSASASLLGCCSEKCLHEYWAANEDKERDYDSEPSEDVEWYGVYDSGRKLYGKNDYANAVKLFDVYMAYNTDNSEAYYYRGDCYRMLDQHDNAIEDFNEAIKLDPNYAIAYGSRGESYRMQNKTDKAIGDFNAAIKLDADYDFAYASRGAAYMQKGQKKQAVNDLEKAVNLNPNNTWAVNELAKARKM